MVNQRLPGEPGRVMALDVGKRRIGVALSDPTRLLASPLLTIHATPPERAFAHIRDLVQSHAVAILVLGLPLTMSGEHGEQASFVHTFAEQLRPYLPDLTITFLDERLTTVAAERLMQDLGLRPEQRRARIDEIAASIILQDYLDTQRGGRYLLHDLEDDDEH